MNNEKKTEYMVYMKAVAALLVLGIICMGTLWLVNGGLSHKRQTTLSVPTGDLNTAPAVVQHFIYNAGNIGNTNMSYDDITNYNSTYPQVFQTAYKNSVSDFANTSTYLKSTNINPDTAGTDTGNQPIVAVVNKSDIQVSKATKIPNIQTTDKYNALQTESAVQVTASFTNTVFTFTKTANDESWNGSYNAYKTNNSFPNIVFTLVYENKKWKIYSISKMDDIGYNFATYDTSFEDGSSNKFITKNVNTTIKKGGNLNEIINKR